MFQSRKFLLWLPFFTLLFILFSGVPAVKAQEPSPIPQLEKLKQELRDRMAGLLGQKDEQKLLQVIVEMAQRDPAGSLGFLLDLVSKSPSAKVRLTVVDYIGRYPDPKVREMLERLAVTDPDAEVSTLALERLRSQRVQEMRELLVRRMEMARREKDEAGLRRLAAEEERWISLVRGTMLPAFLRVPPRLFAVKPENQKVRVIVLGDFGTGVSTQRQVAEAIATEHKKTAFDFGLTVGDNFYDSGMESPTTSRWETLWEEMYGGLGIEFYATLGNHDWILHDSPVAEILYTNRSASWRMPSPYYTFTAGPVQFFALDTNEVSGAQLIWLDQELNKSTALWKVVYGHHPIYSDGDHGDNAALKAKLLSILKGRVHAYFAGHDHLLEHIKPEEGLHFFISGGGGGRLYKVRPNERALFAQSTIGFVTLEADNRQMKLTFIGGDSKLLYEYNLRK